MSRRGFTAFYPSRPFWAGSKVDFTVPRIEGWFHDQMVEDVFSHETPGFSITLSRDGRVMIRIDRLEREDDPTEHTPIEDTVRRWGEYLDYLNTFYLLLDSATTEVDQISYFNLHEITNRDAFRVYYRDGRSESEGIASESIASVFQTGRYSGSYSSADAIEHNTLIWQRRVVTLGAIGHAATNFEYVARFPGLERTVASFAKSLSEYKVGNYETSVVLAWFITEAAMGELWQRHLESLNGEIGDGRRRINRERRDYLTGRDYTASVVSNMLELAGIISHDVFQDIDAVRGVRNKIVHAREYAPGPTEAMRALKIAHLMIERLWGLKFTPNLSYSVSGL